MLCVWRCVERLHVCRDIDSSSARSGSSWTSTSIPMRRYDPHVTLSGIPWVTHPRTHPQARELDGKRPSQSVVDKMAYAPPPTPPPTH